MLATPISERVTDRAAQRPPLGQCFDNGNLTIKNCCHFLVFEHLNQRIRPVIAVTFMATARSARN